MPLWQNVNIFSDVPSLLSVKIGTILVTNKKKSSVLSQSGFNRSAILDLETACSLLLSHKIFCLCLKFGGSLPPK